MNNDKGQPSPVALFVPIYLWYTHGIGQVTNVVGHGQFEVLQNPDIINILDMKYLNH